MTDHHPYGPFPCNRGDCAYVGTVMEKCPCAYDLYGPIPALAGKTVESAEVSDATETLTIRFTDGTTLEAAGYSAQGEGGLSVTVSEDDDDG